MTMIVISVIFLALITLGGFSYLAFSIVALSEAYRIEHEEMMRADLISDNDKGIEIG